MGREEWEENAKFILNSIKELCDDQKAMSDKFDRLHSAVTDQAEASAAEWAARYEKINDRFVSKWVLGVLITVFMSALGAVGYNTSNLYAKVTSSDDKLAEIGSLVKRLDEAFEAEKKLIYLLKLKPGSKVGD